MPGHVTTRKYIFTRANKASAVSNPLLCIGLASLSGVHFGVLLRSNRDGYCCHCKPEHVLDEQHRGVGYLVDVRGSPPCPPAQYTLLQYTHSVDTNSCPAQHGKLNACVHVYGSLGRCGHSLWLHSVTGFKVGVMSYFKYVYRLNVGGY